MTHMRRQPSGGKSKKVYVPSHKWSKGISGTHPGYYRSARPLAKRRIVEPHPIKLYPVHDEYGQFRGWKYKRRVTGKR